MRRNFQVDSWACLWANAALISTFWWPFLFRDVIVAINNKSPADNASFIGTVSPADNASFPSNVPVIGTVSRDFQLVLG